MSVIQPYEWTNDKQLVAWDVDQLRFNFIVWTINATISVFNFTTKINNPNRKKLQCWWDKSGEYILALDLSKSKFSVGNSCNSNNGDFEEIIGWWKMKDKCAGCAI
jgi:type I restriction-modification system DNA methylase subunit